VQGYSGTGARGGRQGDNGLQGQGCFLEGSSGGSLSYDILYLREELEASFSHYMAMVDVEFSDDLCDEQ
jgi:hypothetical protein